MSKYFATAQQGYHARKRGRQLKTGEPVIMIPLFHDGTHWIGLVRREINNRVYFLYSDDMNQRNTEDNIRQIIYTQTDHIFCPPDAEWIHCRSTYYIPHSNECGPRALLAMQIMAFHPHPHANMLLPAMDSNIAQIARTWIASSLVLGRPLHESISATLFLQSFNDSRSSNT